MWNQELEKLNSLVSSAITKYGEKSVGVYIIAYDEITPILIQSLNYHSLEDVRWYGSDSIAENHHLIKNIDSALFVIKTNFSNPLYSLDTKSSSFNELKKEIEMKLHHTDSLIYSAIAYDSFWISALSLDKNSNDDKYNDKKNNTESFKDIVITTSESFPGISGKIELNEAGDRIGENYNFWSVSKHPQKDYYVWKSESVPVETNY